MDNIEHKASAHKIWYRVMDTGSYTEVTLFVEDIANEETLVAQQEGMFDSMDDAQELIKILKARQETIEFIRSESYKGD
ncbi:hypothetical protein [Virgibacillus sp. CBA3643]|uniref:hypothetical protein n=1 Tax=Virgibacillus sp. CBA3643 TaxID=2942278 RepID=UPI0035A39CA1